MEALHNAAGDVQARTDADQAWGINVQRSTLISGGIPAYPGGLNIMLLGMAHSFVYDIDRRAERGSRKGAAQALGGSGEILSGRILQ
jgi:hypothetical protein